MMQMHYLVYRNAVEHSLCGSPEPAEFITIFLERVSCPECQKIYLERLKKAWGNLELPHPDSLTGGSHVFVR